MGDSVPHSPRLACRSNKSPQVSTFCVLAYLAVRVRERASTSSERKTEEYTAGERNKMSARDVRKGREEEGWRSLNLLVVGVREEEEEEEEERPREDRWSRQLRLYIPNRKRDKANKTLSGRRSTNRTPWREKKRREREKEGTGGGITGGQGQRELKLGTKVLTFVPSKVFRIIVVAAERRARRSKAKRTPMARGGPSVIYTLRRFRNY